MSRRAYRRRPGDETRWPGGERRVPRWLDWLCVMCAQCDGAGMIEDERDPLGMTFSACDRCAARGWLFRWQR